MKLTGISPAKKITPHSFRRSFATWCNNNGKDIGLIKVLMGHRSLRTT
jgi:integrase